MPAEISDKVPSIPGMWLLMLVFAAPFAIGTARTWLAWALLPAAIVLSGWSGYVAYCGAFLEGSFSDAVWEELGLVWVVNSFASTILPAAVATAVVWWTVRKRTRETES